MATKQDAMHEFIAQMQAKIDEAMTEINRSVDSRMSQIDRHIQDRLNKIELDAKAQTDPIEAAKGRMYTHLEVLYAIDALIGRMPTNLPAKEALEKIPVVEFYRAMLDGAKRASAELSDNR